MHIVVFVQWFEFLPLILRIFDPERFWQDAVVELLLLDALQKFFVEQTTLFFVQFCLFFDLVRYLLVALFPIFFGLSHLHSTFICHLYELFCSFHLVLMGCRPASHVLLLFGFEPDQVLCLAARVFHFFENLVFFTPQLRDSILEFEDALFLLKSRLPRLPPIGKTVHGSLHSHHRSITFPAAVLEHIVGVRMQLVHAEARLRHGHGLVGSLWRLLPGASALVWGWYLSLFQVLRLRKAFCCASNALVELATLLIHVRDVQFTARLINLRTRPSSFLLRIGSIVCSGWRKFTWSRVVWVGVQWIRNRRHPPIARADFIGRLD